MKKNTIDKSERHDGDRRFDVADLARGIDSNLFSDDDIRGLEKKMIFRLFAARLSTIDLYRVMITEKGLPAAFKKAYDEAVSAFEVFKNQIGK